MYIRIYIYIYILLYISCIHIYIKTKANNNRKTQMATSVKHNKVKRAFILKVLWLAWSSGRAITPNIVLIPFPRFHCSSYCANL